MKFSTHGFEEGVIIIIGVLFVMSGYLIPFLTMYYFFIMWGFAVGDSGANFIQALWITVYLASFFISRKVG